MAYGTRHRLACLLTLLSVTSSADEQGRWSRQLSTHTSEMSDWVPLRAPVEKQLDTPPAPVKRQAVAEPRILSEPFPGLSGPAGFNADMFSTRNLFNAQANRQLYLQSVPSVPSAPQNYLTDQGFAAQGIRFGLSQPNFPLNQGFRAPPLSFENNPIPPQPKLIARPQNVNPVSFPQAASLPVSFQNKPFLNSPQKYKPDTPKFVDGYRVENASNEFGFSSKKKPQSLQKIKFEGNEKIKQEIIPQRSKNEKGEEVQLLYVPLEQLNRGQFNFRSPLTNSQLLKTELYTQNLPRPNPVKPNFLSDFRPSGPNYFADFNAQLNGQDQVAKYTTMTTPFASYTPIPAQPKKLKPHQPPLAIFMKDAGKNSPLKVGDVLSSLKVAETIPVLDSVNAATAPKVFIGPSNMPPPENFVKFDLPYLSNIDHSDSKLKQLPFFVAPLSYNTPNGFAKIPFPSPHVGSVVINSQIKESAQTQAPFNTNFNSNYYTVTNKPETQRPITQKPIFSYYSTASPNTKPVPNYQSNYYSIEPQTVSSIKPPSQVETQTAPPKTGSYFLSNTGSQYNLQDFTSFSPQNNFKSSEVLNQFNHPTQSVYMNTQRPTTTSTTTKPPVTYPSQLLETHNPYSINQAFHFSTPLDYHNYFDDIKQPYVTPSPSPSSPTSPATTPEQKISSKPNYQQQFSPSYLNNYSPEIHYNVDESPKYPVFNPNDYTERPEVTSRKTPTPTFVDNTEVHKYLSDVDTTNDKYNANIDASTNQYVNPTANNYNIDTYNKYNSNFDTTVNTYKGDSDSVDQYNNNQNVETFTSEPENPSEVNNTPLPEYNTPGTYDHQNNYEPTSDITATNPTSSTTTTTTTTRRTPIRSRGRPRYTTTPPNDSNEYTTKQVATRRPLRERRPLPTRPRYEPYKTSTEKSSNKIVDTSESTTKSTKSRTRGRIQYKPSTSEDQYDRKKTHSTKEQDLAYQRDVLHQNYPVTLMERASTVDIEAITEPTFRQSPENVEYVTDPVDTQKAYSHERASLSEQEVVKEITPSSAFSTYQTETPYISKLQSTRNDEYYYQGRSSIAPAETSAFDDAINDKDDDIYVNKQTTPVPKVEKSDAIAYATEATATEETVPVYSSYTENVTVKQVDEDLPEADNTKDASSENIATEVEENIIITTPSYKRVRVRPGAVRQYSQTSSTESPKVKERRRPVQAVTHRPVFDRRRTTMRIDEIEADLKTKQVHVRPEQEYRHPVYKPEASSEPTLVTTTSTDNSITKRNYRRRRPSYSTTSTEAYSTKRAYEVKNVRFRGRRPEKTTEKPDVQTEAPSSTTRASLHSRYSNRPRLSERYNKKPEPDAEIEDQDSNYSISRPKFAEVEPEQWSPKLTVDSFKPYNPNDIVDDQRIATTERRPESDSDLDIITAKNEYDDILLTVTPATNHRMIKKIPDIPPTLEALVEHSKVTKNDSGDSMSTFESMLEEVMKSLEEQDKDEYNSKVKKHKGGEIGEIPPERIISSGDNYTPRITTRQEEFTTEQTTTDASPFVDEVDKERKSRRRGFWKKVKVRPVTTENIEFAESQYYGNSVNRLGQTIKDQKTVHEKAEHDEKVKVTTYKPKFQSNVLDTIEQSKDQKAVYEKIDNDEKTKVTTYKPKFQSKVLDTTEQPKDQKAEKTDYNEKDTVTTYKPQFQFLSDFFSNGDDFAELEEMPQLEFNKIKSTGSNIEETVIDDQNKHTTAFIPKELAISPGDLDLGTGSPDPTIDDIYNTTPTEPMPTKADDRSDGFSFMDYLFGITSQEGETHNIKREKNITRTTESEPQTTTELSKAKIVTTESGFIPEEITTSIPNDSTDVPDVNYNKNSWDGTEKVNEDTTGLPVNKVESSSMSSFMDPTNVMSTSMSTEISHETEICFRGKCIKTSKNIL